MTLFLTVAVVQFVALATPGPDFFFVSQTAVSRSRREAIFGAIGITVGVMVWAAVALMGLHLLLQKMAWLHSIIVVCGGAYLCWMGFCLLRSVMKKEMLSHDPEHDVAAVSASHAFVKGLLTNLSNPKVLIYFGSVFSVFVGDDVASGARWGIFGLIAVETILWFSLVAFVFALPAMRRGYQRAAKWIDGVAGALFAGFGLNLIISRLSL
ncbi:threonine export protein RhtC [Leminorella grimontii]|uniref:Threonine export protein RhtC n=1 Tax=Leminorella grimontii TaxID=82981 RepID=A0AAV5N5J6_9GAMM|nr:threonine export protein RhtC [Leminorella grimontii]KFC93932.1 L-lysine permease [Leminorella grimontii ATCC 33999 = DSM 5078]GKX57265.1 threonine export protein RhtC [Leminorella grimontii]GKX61066.1 threonine export protein RhtC [Leminorella grimontii]